MWTISMLAQASLQALLRLSNPVCAGSSWMAAPGTDQVVWLNPSSWVVAVCRLVTVQPGVNMRKRGVCVGGGTWEWGNTREDHQPASLQEVPQHSDPVLHSHTISDGELQDRVDLLRPQLWVQDGTCRLHPADQRGRQGA